MATTFTQLEVGQKQKEATINTNFSKIYLGELADDTAADALTPVHGSTYFNTTSSKLRVLGTDDVWRNAA